MKKRLWTLFDTGWCLRCVYSWTIWAVEVGVTRVIQLQGPENIHCVECGISRKDWCSCSYKNSLLVHKWRLATRETWFFPHQMWGMVKAYSWLDWSRKFLKYIVTDSCDKSGCASPNWLEPITIDQPSQKRRDGSGPAIGDILKDPISMLCSLSVFQLFFTSWVFLRSLQGGAIPPLVNRWSFLLLLSTLMIIFAFMILNTHYGKQFQVVLACQSLPAISSSDHYYLPSFAINHSLPTYFLLPPY